MTGRMLGVQRLVCSIPSIKFLINPVASHLVGRDIWMDLHAACVRLGYREGVDFSLEWTRAGETVDQARQAAASWERVVAVGGDGTVGQVVEGLFKSATGAALGVIPQGTGNDFSRAIGAFKHWRRWPRKGLESIVTWLLTSPTRPVDVLTANDRRYFVSYGSIGFDAEVARAYAQLRRRLGRVLRGRILAEAIYGMLALRYYGTHLPNLQMALHAVHTGWSTTEILQGTCAIIVSNIGYYAGGMSLAREAHLDDRHFEVTVIRRAWLYALLTASRLWPNVRQACQLPSWRVQEVRLPLPCGMAVQLDGEDYTEGFANEAILAVRVAGQIAVVGDLEDPSAAGATPPPSQRTEGRRR